MHFGKFTDGIHPQVPNGLPTLGCARKTTGVLCYSPACAAGDRSLLNRDFTVLIDVRGHLPIRHYNRIVPSGIEVPLP